jgi:arylsulfatase A-like enzyme
MVNTWGEHDLVGDAKDLYQETNHIPLLMKAVNQLRPRIDSRPVSLVDIPALITGQLSDSVRHRGRQLFPNRRGVIAVSMLERWLRRGLLHHERRKALLRFYSIVRLGSMTTEPEPLPLSGGAWSRE